MDVATGAGDEDRREEQPQIGAPRAAGYAEKAAVGARGGFFQVYKPGQGYYTRLGSGVFFGVLIVWGAQFAFEQMAAFYDANKAWTLYLRYGVPVGILAGLGLALYWILCVNHRAIDFFIATEGEMKKVSWSSRREVIGSTKVVIATVIIMGTLLFFVDMAFITFFSAINVLKLPPGALKRLLGLES